MKTPLQHIEDQLWEVRHLANKDNKRYAEAVLKGLCEDYRNLGLITPKEWEQLCPLADGNYPTSAESRHTKDSDWLIPFD